MRSGRFIGHVNGYKAFHPARLPPDPSLGIEGDLQRLLSDADRALGRLDGVASGPGWNESVRLVIDN